MLDFFCRDWFMNDISRKILLTNIVIALVTLVAIATPFEYEVCYYSSPHFFLRRGITFFLCKSSIIKSNSSLNLIVTSLFLKAIP